MYLVDPRISSDPHDCYHKFGRPHIGSSYITHIVAGATRPCNSIFGENKLVAKKLGFVLFKLQISIWKDRATVAW